VTPSRPESTGSPQLGPTGTVETSRPRGGRRDLPRLAVAFDVTSTSPLDLKGVVEGVCSIVWVVDMGDPALGTLGRLLPRLGTVVDTHGLPFDAVAERVADLGVEGVIAFTDTQLGTAAAVAEWMGLVGNPSEVVDRLNDKVIQRRCLSSAGIPVPRFHPIPGASVASQVAAAVQDLRFPLVIKPVRGDSSREVHRVADLPTLIDLFETRLSANGRPVEEFIAEEYIADRPTVDPAVASYVSVELITQEGVPVPLAVTGKFSLVQPFRETGNFMPHPLEADEASAVLDLAVESAQALEVRTGALHTEIKLTPDGPRIIEVNGRVGGGAIDALFSKTHERSLTELAIRVALGQPVKLVSDLPDGSSGPFDFEFFVQPPVSASRLRSMAGTEELVGVAGTESVAVNKSPGDELHWQQGSQGYLVQVGGRVQDQTALAAVPHAVLAQLEFEFD
jgi:biotin carboxylase